MRAWFHESLAAQNLTADPWYTLSHSLSQSYPTRSAEWMFRFFLTCTKTSSKSYQSIVVTITFHDGIWPRLKIVNGRFQSWMDGIQLLPRMENIIQNKTITHIILTDVYQTIW